MDAKYFTQTAKLRQVPGPTQTLQLTSIPSTNCLVHLRDDGYALRDRTIPLTTQGSPEAFTEGATG